LQNLCSFGQRFFDSGIYPWGRVESLITFPAVQTRADIPADIIEDLLQALE